MVIYVIHTYVGHKDDMHRIKIKSSQNERRGMCNRMWYNTDKVPPNSSRSHRPCFDSHNLSGATPCIIERAAVFTVYITPYICIWEKNRISSGRLSYIYSKSYTHMIE